MSVLLVSDGREWQREITDCLEDEGFAVCLDTHGDALRDPSCPFDLAIVDMSLRTRVPADVCAELRTRTAIPVLAVAEGAVRDADVLGVLEAGADQLLVQGARSRELVARVRALLRRSPPQRRALIDLRSAQSGSLVIDLATATVQIDGADVYLTREECAVLHALVRRPGHVVARAELITLLSNGSGHALDAVVRRVRTKVEAIEGQRRIEAVRGVGFRLLADVTAKGGCWAVSGDSE